MAIRTYNAHINLDQNELQNAVIQQLASAPGSPVEGQIYYNTADDTVYVRANGAWLDLGQQGITDGDYGDITVGGGGTTLTIDDDAVTYAKIQNVVANNVFLGNNAGAGGIVDELTGTEATAMLDQFTSGLQGVVPASGGGTSNYLRADGSWSAPPGSALPVADNNSIVEGSVDPTKELRFEVDGNTTGIVGVIATVFTTAKTWTIPDFTDTSAGISAAQTLTNKTIDADNNTITNIGDAEIETHTTTKISTTNKGLLNSAIVYNDQINVFGDFNQTFQDNRLLIRNPANTFSYTIQAAAIGADRTLNLPLITGTDTLATLGLSQTFTGTVTLNSFKGTGAVTVTNILDDDTMATASATSLATSESIKAYVDSQVAGGVTYKGGFDPTAGAGAGSPDLDAITSTTGDMYTVTVAGTYNWTTGSAELEVGDVLIAESDGVLNNVADWTIVQKNETDVVTGPVSAVNNNVVFFDGTSGKLIKDSGLTLSGSNTGDQTSIVGITGTKAEFNTACTNGTFMFLDSADTITGIKIFNDGTLKLDDSDSAFNLILQSTSTITTADKTLTFDISDTSQTLTMTASTTLSGGTHSGTNTGDEVAASESVAGVAEIATQAETNAGTDDARFITPLKLFTYLGTDDANLVASVTYQTSIGNGVSTSYTVTHNIGRQYVNCQVYDTLNSNAEVDCEIRCTSTTQVTILVNSAPATDQYEVVITG